LLVAETELGKLTVPDSETPVELTSKD